MCGITGVFKKQGHVDHEMLNRALSRIRHRGPNDEGIWIDNQIGLAHVRLSIRDLSAAGHQPMFSASGKWVIVYNGEIYNYAQLKQELLVTSFIDFASHSDTEVLINAIECWGLEKTLQKCRGMFAFAAWNRETKQLYLARDRFGEKPLYYGIIQNDFIFASELKALQVNYRDKLIIDRDALTSYMRYSYVPTPFCIYKNIFKLDAGCYLSIDQHLNLTQHQYWNPAKAINVNNHFSGDYQAAVNQLESLLRDTLSLQMTADVPLGAFLSGGIDSSTIVALMQSLSKEKIKTFSIGFENKQFNEAEYAKQVAAHLQTDHTELYVNKHDVLNVVPHLASLYDEPFADSSQIPTYLVSKIAKSRVTVSLSGDAGDELFGGYNRYLIANKIKNKVIDQSFVRHLVSHTPAALIKLIGCLPSRYNQLADKFLKIQRIVKNSNTSPYHFYNNLCSQIYDPEDLVLQGKEHDIFEYKELLDQQPLCFQSWMMFADAKTYMIDDILTKVDRAAMAVSLETRIPFLDHSIYEFAWSLPLEYKIKNGIGKRVLRDVLYRYVPKALVERPKMGFGVPLAEWLRGDLKEWAADMLDERMIKQQGYLNHHLVQQYWRAHQSKRQNWQSALWNILMFQMWYKEYHCS